MIMKTRFWNIWNQKTWRVILGLVIIIELDSSLKIKINSRFQLIKFNLIPNILRLARYPLTGLICSKGIHAVGKSRWQEREVRKVLKIRNEIGKNQVGKLEPKLLITIEIVKWPLEFESFQFSWKEAFELESYCLNWKGTIPVIFPTSVTFFQTHFNSPTSTRTFQVQKLSNFHETFQLKRKPFNLGLSSIRLSNFRFFPTKRISFRSLLLIIVFTKRSKAFSKSKKILNFAFSTR